MGEISCQETWHDKISMLREIIEDNEVANIIDAACENNQRFRDVWNGFKWLLAKKAHEMGNTIGYGNNIRIHKQEGYLLIGIPTIIVTTSTVFTN